MALTLLKSTGQLFWLVWCFFMTIKLSTDSSFIDDGSLDHLIWVMSTRLLHCKGTILLFLINRYFVRRHFELHSFHLSLNSQVIYLFILEWIHGISFYSNSYNPLLLFFDTQIVPNLASRSQDFCVLWTCLLSFFEHFLVFWYYMFQAYLVLSSPDLKLAIYLRSPHFHLYLFLYVYF